MQINRSTNCLNNLVWILSDQSGNHAGENIAAATFSQPRVSGGIHPQMSFSVRDESSPSLEHQDQPMLTSKVAGDLDAIRFDFANTAIYEPSHLSRMWRKHQRSFRSVQKGAVGFKSIQSIGIDHKWKGTRAHEILYTTNGLGITAQPWPNRHYVFAFQYSR